MQATPFTGYNQQVKGKKLNESALNLSSTRCSISTRMTIDRGVNKKSSFMTYKGDSSSNDLTNFGPLLSTHETVTTGNFGMRNSNRGLMDA